MGDLFYMNLEERSIPEAIKKASKALFHLYLGDSNRAAPGEGHLDFKPIVKAFSLYKRAKEAVFSKEGGT